MLREVKVLDQGFVRLITWMPFNMVEIAEFLQGVTTYPNDPVAGEIPEVTSNDLAVVNAARVSFNKESLMLSKADRRLIAFLAEHGHSSPARHTMVTMEVQAPMMVARQWFKYVVGSVHTQDSFELLGLGNGDDSSMIDPMYARNESSRRYVTEEPLFHLPEPGTWRSAPENRKQGSGGPVDSDFDLNLTRTLKRVQGIGRAHYEWALKEGVCAEQARLYLPAYSMYLHWRWSASLVGICHFLNQRLGEGAQVEINAYAHAVYDLVCQPEVYPVTAKEMLKDVTE